MNDEAVYAYRFAGKRFDCGSKIGYLQANVEYALAHPELAAPFKAYLKKLAKDCNRCSIPSRCSTSSWVAQRLMVTLRNARVSASRDGRTSKRGSGGFVRGAAAGGLLGLLLGGRDWASSRVARSGKAAPRPSARCAQGLPGRSAEEVGRCREPHAGTVRGLSSGGAASCAAGRGWLVQFQLGDWCDRKADGAKWRPEADGRTVDADEQQRLFAEVERRESGCVRAKLLACGSASSQSTWRSPGGESGGVPKVYLASRMAIKSWHVPAGDAPDLDALAARLKLPD